MKAALTGAGGLIGAKLRGMLHEMGYEVLSIGRSDLYGPANALAEKINGACVLVHLAGAPVLRRWTQKYRQKIFSSRIDTTRNLSDALALIPSPPGIFITASAVGIYSDKGVHSESSTDYSNDFLGKVCQSWEQEAEKAPQGIRVVRFRFGIVLDSKGGALPRMVLPFRLFAGGRIGSGKQFMSWVHIYDVVEIFRFAIRNPELAGAVNVLAPNSVTNLQFTKILAKVMGKPAIFAVPGFVLKLLFGKGADVLTKGQNAIPEKLLTLGFRFKFSQLHLALADLLLSKSDKVKCVRL